MYTLFYFCCELWGNGMQVITPYSFAQETTDNPCDGVVTT